MLWVGELSTWGNVIQPVPGGVLLPLRDQVCQLWVFLYLLLDAGLNAKIGMSAVVSTAVFPNL